MKKENSKNSHVNKPVFLRSQSASSTVVGAVLLLAIIVSIFSVIRIGYIPEWKNDAEYSHMNDILGDMTDLKSKIDLITIVMASGSNSSNTVTMNVPFHMGGGDVPLIGTIKSSGTLSVVNNLGNNMTVTAFCDQSNSISKINYGTVSYNSQNRYYVDQEFTYEDGALILSQGERSSMMLYPSIRFSAMANRYNVSIHMVEIDKSTYSPADVMSSNTGCFIRLTGKEFRTLYDSNDVSDKQQYGNLSNFTLTVNTEYPDAWYLYLNETITGARIKNYSNLTKNGNNVTLTFPANESSEKYLNRLYVSETKVKVEPGIGI